MKRQKPRPISRTSLFEHNKSSIDRLKEIITIAVDLKWINPPQKIGYPTMQLSEVEKCMLSMCDDRELDRLRQCQKDKKKENKK